MLINYIDMLNEWDEHGHVVLRETENYWIDQVRQFFSNQPFVLSSDTSGTVGANIDELLKQAKRREHENPGTRYVGVILQHLVAAKLQLILPPGKLVVHGATVADESTDRAGDFIVGKTAIHCTTMPGELLMRKCAENIRGDLSPFIITLEERKDTAKNLLEDIGLKSRVEVWDIQQFLSSNVAEHSLFEHDKRNLTLAEIIDNYNKIIDENETDPSLRIEFNA